MGASKQIKHRLAALESHLQQENPVLVDVVRRFARLDAVGYRMGLLTPDQSFAARISWWPLISVLGTFSAGKSTFINHYLGYRLQSTGNQAVDDKFTVVCFTRDNEVRQLPGISLDADPRFPFFQISEELEKVAAGEGRRVDAYLQMKTCPSENLRGKILIDSPGFDADAQRTAILRITDYIINLSDLVLVLFDARHPEPGAMRDTLKHLVGDTIHRPDSSKFLYILNQIDTAAREDNPEAVVGAWQRALSQEGLTAGKFYSIYNPDAAVPIEDASLRKRFETKRDLDLAEIHQRMRQVSVERAYRIIGALEKIARDIEDDKVPRLSNLIGRWRRSVLVRDGIIAALIAAIVVGALLWNGVQAAAQIDWTSPILLALLAALAMGAIYVHFFNRRAALKSLLRRTAQHEPASPDRDSLMHALRRNTRWWRSIFLTKPAGWSGRARSRLHDVSGEADRLVQVLNDRFASPSGPEATPTAAAPTAPRFTAQPAST